MVRYVAFVALVLTAGLVLFGGGDEDLRDEQLPAAGSLPDENLVRTISRGEEVDIESHLADGYAVVSFKADW